jgi:putative transposase
LNRVLSVLQLAKSTWYASQRRQTYEQKYAYVRTPLLAIAMRHPEYGYRRTAAELRARGYLVGRKVVQRLHRQWELALRRRIKKPGHNPVHQLVKEAGKRANLVAGLEEIHELSVLYTDFTQIRYQHGLAAAWLMPIIDHASKLVVGHALGEQADTALALLAWEHCQATLHALGLSTRGMIVHHDQDGVYLGYGWLKQLLTKDGIRVSYSLTGAKGNVHMESFNGRFKEENHLLFWEQENLNALKKVVAQRMKYYNQVRRHSSLGNRSPITYLKEKGVWGDAVDSGN